MTNKYSIRASDKYLEEMKREYNRKESFGKAFSKTEREKMAKSGFFWLELGESDCTIQCAFCRVTISYYRRGADYDDLHIKASPFCPLMMHNPHVGNLEIRDDNIPTIFRYNDITYDPYGNQMKNEIDRIETFENWPHSFIQYKEFSSNGFYYLKTKDKVTFLICIIPSFYLLY